MAKPKLLIVEDDEGICSQYRWAFPACEVVITHNRAAALAAVQTDRPQIAILDLGLPPDADGVTEGFATLEAMQRMAPDMKAIVATGNGEKSNALKAIASGAYDFCEKPVEIDVLRTIVERGLRLHQLEDENRRLAAAPSRSPIDRIVTANDAMLKVCRSIEKLATANVTVLLLGESGTGKEALAEALHELGPRAKQPFVAINCGAIPENVAGKRAVRTRARRIHRSHQADHRQDRERQPRNPVSRRDRRSAAAAAGQAPSLPAGSGDRTDRRPPADPGRCAHRLGDQCQPRGSGRGRHVPRATCSTA